MIEDVQWTDVATGATCLRGVDEALADARVLLEAGKLLLTSTDTVLGVVAAAMDPMAVAGIARVKGRDLATPPPVVVGSVEEALALALPSQRPMLERCALLWPGPVSLVVEVLPSLARAVHPGGTSVALRVPDDPILARLARDLPLAASSANLHGHPTAATVRAALAQLAGRDGAWERLAAGGIAAGLWWAPARALPSTVVDLTGRAPRILRDGAVTRARVVSLLERIARTGI